MKKRINKIIIFYTLYFTWLLLLTHLWPDPKTLTLILIAIVLFYFTLLYEKYDFWFFTSVVVLSYLIGKYLANDPTFASRGFPPLGVPFWPIAWGITAVALRKFYLSLNEGWEQL